MRYTVSIQSWGSHEEIPYSRELEDAISEAVINWIYENIECPGNWTTHIHAESDDDIF